MAVKSKISWTGHLPATRLTCFHWKSVAMYGSTAWSFIRQLKVIELNPKARESFRCLKHAKINVLLVALPDFSKPFLAERNGIDQRFLYARKSNALLSVSSFEQETKLFIDAMNRNYSSKDTNSIKEWNAPRRSLQNCRINAIRPRRGDLCSGLHPSFSWWYGYNPIY